MNQRIKIKQNGKKVFDLNINLLCPSQRERVPSRYGTIFQHSGKLRDKCLKRSVVVEPDPVPLLTNVGSGFKSGSGSPPYLEPFFTFFFTKSYDTYPYFFNVQAALLPRKSSFHFLNFFLLFYFCHSILFTVWIQVQIRNQIRNTFRFRYGEKFRLDQIWFQFRFRFRFHDIAKKELQGLPF